MYGIVNKAIQDLVIANFGEENGKPLRKEAT